MSLRRSLSLVGQTVLVAAVVALAVGALLGQPILFGFVETGSMAPTLDPGDGFVAIPSFVAGDVEVGDVVVFEAQELHDGGLTTHRVVGETEGGYVTKGDANPFTDQDGPEPPVTDDQIVAEAWAIGDWVVAIPYLGMGVLLIRGVVSGFQREIASALGLGPPYGTQDAGIFLVTLGIVVLALTVIQDALSGPTRDRRRSRSRSGTVDANKVTALLLIVVLLPANAAMLLPAGSEQLAVEGDVAVASPELEPGEPASWEYSIRNFGVIPVALTLDSESGAVTTPADPVVLGPRGHSTVEVAMDTPPPGERAVADVREHRYLLVLPPSIVGWLHGISPLFALLSINLVLIGGVLLLTGRVIGFGVLRIRWGSDVGLWTRLRRRYG